MTRPHLPTLIAGLAVACLGGLLLAGDRGEVALRFGALAPALSGATAVVLLAGRLAPGRHVRGETAAGVGALVLTLLLVARETGLWVGDAVAWPLALAAAGVALVWRPPDRTPDQPSSPRAPATRGTATATATGSGTAERPALARAGLGAALIAGAGLLFLQLAGALQGARDTVLGAVVVLVALALILAPLWWRLGHNLAAERTARIRSQERAEVAAHLHDSVLQTLALVQRRAADPRAVATLARRQERELRAWLAGARQARPEERLADALEQAAAEVEEDQGVPIDIVTVGDRGLDERGRALVAAAREALVNAAKFAGEAGPVALYAEMDAGRAQVFVRDRGPGFDPAAAPPDRRGVRDSIVGRMARHGGVASIQAAPGGGTEVELRIEDPTR